MATDTTTDLAAAWPTLEYINVPLYGIDLCLPDTTCAECLFGGECDVPVERRNGEAAA